MKVYVIVVSMLMKLAASTVDEELQVKYTTMSRSNFVEHFNENNYPWKMKQYSNKVFTFNFNQTFFNVHRRNFFDALPQKRHDPAKVGPLPENFDSREKWPYCHSIGEIYDQMICESCWAHGVANTASDRTCIHTNRTVDLSEQDLECAHESHSICKGGYHRKGFTFWKEKGLVTQKCKPYHPQSALQRGVCEERCYYPSQSYQLDKHYTKEIYQVPNDDYQIKAELYLNGPVVAYMNIYEDFQDDNGYGYHSGIYVRTHGVEPKGGHAVRVIGYGIEDGIPYWLVANSWSREWGENGFFRIKRFQLDVHFESMMLGGIPEREPRY